MRKVKCNYMIFGEDQGSVLKTGHIFKIFFLSFFQITCFNSYILVDKCNNTLLSIHMRFCVDLICAILLAIQWFGFYFDLVK